MSFFSFTQKTIQISNNVKIDQELFIFSPDTNFSCKQNLIYVSILRDLAYKIKGAVIREVLARNVAEGLSEAQGLKQTPP